MADDERTFPMQRMMFVWGVVGAVAAFAMACSKTPTDAPAETPAVAASPAAVPAYTIASMKSFVPGSDNVASMALRARGPSGKSTLTLDPKHELRLKIAPPEGAKTDDLVLRTFGRQGDAIEALLPQLRPNAAGIFEVRVPGSKLYAAGRDALDLHFVITTRPQSDPATNKLDYNEARESVKGVWLEAQIKFELL